MKSTIFIRHLCILLLFTAWQSCRKEDGPDKQDDGIRIENLDTRLRIAVPDNLFFRKGYNWRLLYLDNGSDRRAHV